MKHNMIIHKIELGLSNPSTLDLASLLFFKALCVSCLFLLKIAEKYWLHSKVQNFWKGLLSRTVLYLSKYKDHYKLDYSRTK